MGGSVILDAPRMGVQCKGAKRTKGGRIGVARRKVRVKLRLILYRIRVWSGIQEPDTKGWREQQQLMFEAGG
ncbi:uncharacterized protein SPSK_10215 [Sporothrix schenckii 1099-18]|uniref:Uncharacterized protein n=1 Tax=Sporothrix schenckii 1099-18 TaxID=1397361 RepID=A0A0F2M7R9_SPOSC|nr:uncharacterized protein SPSK_10215 [Sporothrix schenckii 1099-18]KJR84221.1 hypothetical protein SPSK_10215 [Sporothrix schenckii 1099-18]